MRADWKPVEIMTLTIHMVRQRLPAFAIPSGSAFSQFPRWRAF